MFVSSGKELIEICNEQRISIWEYTIREEIEKSESNRKLVKYKKRCFLSWGNLHPHIISMGVLSGQRNHSPLGSPKTFVFGDR